MYPDLTKSQRQLADFIATSYRQAAFMTASRLAAELGLNEATVIRFAQRLGYPGYPQLTEDVQKLVQAELGAMGDEPLVSADSPLETVLQAEMENLQRAIAHLSPEVGARALAMMKEAKHICILGQGAAGPLAQIMSLGLTAIGIDADSPSSDPINLSVMLRGLQPDTLVVAISVALETQELANALRYAREQGAKTLALTWSPISLCSQAADLAVSYMTDDSLPIRGITVPALVVDALVQALAASDQANLARVREFGEIRDRLVGRG
jgi:DNA-binding MurR/RpiR family transcriptional regulator